MSDLAQLDATAQAELVRGGEISPQELAQAAIERIEALNGELNAVIHPLFEKALSTEPADGPFRGVPMVIKDLICNTAGDPAHQGMKVLKELDWHEPEDTWLARRYREAGFVFVGRTNTPEMGILPTTEPEAYGPTRNPWNTAHSPGGSSGGSASAVAAGIVPIGHANDGGGSIRIPASCCGLVGLKPTRGRVSLSPMGDFASGLGIDLVVSRSVRDTAAVLEWVSDPPPGEAYVAPPRQRAYTEEVGADPGKLRIGLVDVAPLGLGDVIAPADVDLEPEPGDAVLFHTGWGAKWDDAQAYLSGEPGPGLELAEWLAARGVALTGCDTWSYGPVPAEDPERPFEVPQQLNVRHGVFVVENLDTSELAADGIREFALVLTFPKLRGATGGWTSPLALV
jgi:Asp-tRNA(Asn)/Glu-tRNA(Gln) amidotransferase A subunit family amidase